MNTETAQNHEDNLFIIKAPKGTVKIAKTPEERLTLFNNFHILLFFLTEAIGTPEKTEYEIVFDGKQSD